MKKKNNLKQNQAHGKPNKANPPTDSQKKKKKKKKHKIKNQTYPLYHGHVAIEITEKINP